MTEGVLRSVPGADPAAPDSDRTDIDALNATAWNTRLSQPAQARQLFVEAARRSRSGGFAVHAYAEGLAFSVAGQSLMALVEGRHDESAGLALEALALVADRPHCEAEVCARTVLAWIDIYLGENAKALEAALEVLRVAKELGLAYWEARANILVGTVYRNMGAGAQALEAQTRALQLCRQQPMADNEIMVLHHISDTLLFLGDAQGSLERAFESLASARKLGYGIAEFMASITAVETLVALGEPERAVPFLPHIRRLIPPDDRSVFRVNYHQVAGKVAVVRGDYPQAEREFNQGLDFATQLKATGEMCGCHQLLADMYETMGDLRNALDHFKRFYELQQVVNGEKTRQRAAVLTTLHQVAAAQRDAELYRAHNAALKQEIEERKKLELRLAELAHLDPLTQLLNRSYFLELAQREVARVGRTGSALSILFLDVDFFKQINDRFGHLVGDQVLVSIARVLRGAVREIDVVARFGGEEFAVALPDTALPQARDVAERIRTLLQERPLSTDQGDVPTTISIGVACLTSGASAGSDALRGVIQSADEALYRAKRAGRNRTEVQDG